MNRGRLLVLLTLILYVMQVTVVVSSLLFSDDRTPLSAIASILVAFVIGVIDVAVIRYLLATLKRAEHAYSQDLNRKLEESFQSYRQEAEREDRLTQEVVQAVERELAQARSALASQSFNSVDDHLRAGLAIASQAHVAYCDNVTVSAVLESKSRQCENAGVTMRARVSLPQELPLPDIDVAALFFNLIDNALHECEELLKVGKADGRPVIDVRSQMRANQLFLEVDNPTRAGGDARRRDAARHARRRGGHGWGTQVVSAVVDQYGGIAEFREDGGVFTADVMIPLPDQPQNVEVGQGVGHAHMKVSQS